MRGRRWTSVEYLEKPHEAHGFYDVDNKTELYERVLAFLNHYLAAAMETVPA